MERWAFLQPITVEHELIPQLSINVSLMGRFMLYADGCAVVRNRVLKHAYIILPIHSSARFSMLSPPLMTSERILFPRIPCLCNFWSRTLAGCKRKALPIMQFWLTQLCWAAGNSIWKFFFCPFFCLVLLFLTCDILDLQKWNNPHSSFILDFWVVALKYLKTFDNFNL